jgi:hypothetical protein
MTQADRVLSTPPTNTSLDKTRRHFLMAVGAGSAAMLAATIPDPAASAPASPYDAVYGLIESHRAACLAHLASIDEQNRLELLDDPLAETVSEAPCHAEWDAFYALLETAPLTFAGLIAWSAYLDEQRRDHEWRLDGLDIVTKIVGTFAEALRNLTVTS